MRRIGIWLGGSSHSGGSYQFWLSVIKALSEFENAEYHVTVLSDKERWIGIAKEYGLENIRLKGKKSWLNRRVENTYWGFRHVSALRRILSFFYKHLDCNLRSLKGVKFDLGIAQQVDIMGDLFHIPMLIPIFDLMHRYDGRFPELTSEYTMRERIYSHQCQKAEIILADSEVGRQHILECYGKLRKDLSQCVKILPFVPPDYIYTAKMQPVKEPLYEKYMFYPAQFWTHKNHKNLILAAAQLKRKGIPIKLVFVGSEQNNKEDVLTIIQKKGMQEDIKILGYVSNEEMVWLYRHARAMVMPTCLGPTNIPQLEAFELGCPVATSRIYGIPEQVGDAALLFDPDSVEEIASCMERLWQEDRLCESLIEKGKARAASWGQKQFNEQFKEIITDYLCSCHP